MTSWSLRRASVLCGVALSCLVPLPVSAKSPPPEFAVKSIFEENLARKFAQYCVGIDFDHGGHDRHIRKRLGDFSNRGVHSRNIFKNYAPIQAHRYQRYIVNFNRRHGLGPNSPLDAFCAAGAEEMSSRSPMGQMLKPAKKRSP